MISFRQKGNFEKTNNFFRNLTSKRYLKVLDRYGREGVAALSSVTPVDTGLTASSWYYKIEHNKTSTSLVFCNSNIQNGVPIAIILQYGHATRNGGWVEGRDYINSTVQPIFDKLASDAWREVTKL